MLWSVIVVLVLLACGAWVTVRAFQAKANLQASVGLVAEIQSQVGTGDAKAATAMTVELERRVHAARDETSDPIWRAAEIIPVVGPNLTAVRVLSSVTSDVTDSAIKPLVSLTGSLSVSSFKPTDGAIPLRPLIKAAPVLTAANASVQTGLSRVRALDTSTTVGVVSKAVHKLRTTLDAVGHATDAASRAAQLLPAMLGDNGPRNYLLVVQNNAEARATGGIVGAVVLLHTEDGAVTLAKQASASGFPIFKDPVLPLPPATRALYKNITGEFIQDVTLTPRFALSAELARAMWKIQFGTEIDGVLSIDPIALSALLTATGSVEMSTGDQLTSGNVVQLLLSQVYARYSDPEQQNTFFATAAAAIFTKVARGDVDPKQLIAALAEAGNEHRLLVWSAHPKEQSSIAKSTLAGGLPASSPTRQRFGIYLNDATGAKMDYYLNTSIQLGRAVCRADKRPNFLVRVTLKSSAPADAATALPWYVTGAGLAGVPAGDIRTALAVYAPPGAVLVNAVSEGKNVPVQRVKDGDHPVAQLFVELRPGQSTTYVFAFVGAAVDADASGPVTLSAQTTPGVYATTVLQTPLRCSEVAN